MVSSNSRGARSEATRMRILEAARCLLVERGFHGVGLEEVAREAAVSRQTVYLHFGSKSELLIAVARHVDASIGAAELLRPVIEAPTALEALDRAIEADAVIEARIHDVAAVIDAARRSDEAAEAAWQDRMANRHEFIGALVARIEAEGALAEGWTRADAADLLCAVLSPHTYEYLVTERGWPIERFTRRLRQLARVFVEPGPNGPP